MQTYIIYKLWIYNIFTSFRAYGAWCDNVNVNSKIESEGRAIPAEYNSKLVNENRVVLDPVSLKYGWLKEKDSKKEDGILQWPSTDYLDIANIIGLTQPDFLKRLQSNCKQWKCYRYFICEFVREFLYHPITATSVMFFETLRCVGLNKKRIAKYLMALSSLLVAHV